MDFDRKLQEALLILPTKQRIAFNMRYFDNMKYDEISEISIDGIFLSEFDFIDIGEIIPSSGAVPVVIKSLVFPAS